MALRVDELVKGIFRISDFWPEHGITLNQFVIAGDRPALIHTGTHPAYESVRKGVAQVIDPKRLAYVIVPHFEADECGGMGRFVAEAPEATLVCSDAGYKINLSGWDYRGPVKGVCDGDVIETGEHRLRFIETPHVHHWDSMMVLEETTRSIFPADLFIQPGDQPPIVAENLGNEMCQLFRGAGIFASEKPVRHCVDRLERFKPQWMHPMHGGSLQGTNIANYVKALREKEFAFDGMLFGRPLPT